MRKFRQFFELRFDKCRPEAAGDVISSRFVRAIALDRHVKARDRCLTVLEKFHQKPLRAVFADSVFRYNFRPEVDNEDISGIVIERVGIDVHVKFGDSRSDSSPNIRGAVFASNERTSKGKCRSLSHKAEMPYRRFA